MVVYECGATGALARPNRASASTGEDARASTNLKEFLRFTFPRQREGRKLCISDFFAPKSSGKMDVIGLSLVTIGSKASIETQRLFEAGDVFQRRVSAEVPMGDQLDERRHLGFIATGNALPATVHAPAQPYTFFHMKGDPFLVRSVSTP